jgi:hypothetical protein
MLDMNVTAVAVSMLAVWRVTHLIVAEDGPWNALVHLRSAFAAIGLKRLMDCFYCASVWIAIPFALLIAREWRTIAICIPALSGGAIVLERLTAHDDAAAIWMEEEKS